MDGSKLSKTFPPASSLRCSSFRPYIFSSNLWRQIIGLNVHITMAHIKLDIRVSQNLARLKGKGRQIKNNQTNELSFIHSFILLPLTRNTTRVYRNTLKIIYNIPTKLFTRSNVVKARKPI